MHSSFKYSISIIAVDRSGSCSTGGPALDHDMLRKLRANGDYRGLPGWLVRHAGG